MFYYFRGISETRFDREIEPLWQDGPTGEHTCVARTRLEQQTDGSIQEHWMRFQSDNAA